MPFDSFLRFVACVLCFYLFLHHSQSENAGGANNSNSSSQEHILPTPLILHLNQSAAQMLIQEANSMFVSNTSINDIINDNETQQMLIRYRERFSIISTLLFWKTIIKEETVGYFHPQMKSEKTSQNIIYPTRHSSKVGIDTRTKCDRSSFG
ncbi:unnamed protein product [Larinioides sclopetarius]|uniref:Uncharacterized protein n=1 Tax=Larinioides sclopetarius TaxID=280406 RepID=A0AAV1ZWH8_9ARAC